MRWRSPPLPLLLLFLSFFTPSAGKDFRICVYNVPQFNTHKAANYRVMHTLTRVLARCDISLLQGVMDPDGKVVQSCLSALNRATDRYDEYTYKAVVSKSLGTSPSTMEQYVFVYRTNTVSVLGQHQYQGKRSFVRAPFAVQFQGKKTVIKKFVLVPLHSEPSRAVQEIDWLYDVFEEVTKKWNNTNVILAGDFHASCAYVTKTNRKNIRMFKNSSFSWLIGDRVDTTVGEDTNCAYDRIVVFGEPFLKAIQPLSARVLHIAKEFKLSKTKVLEVSDHNPLEVKLKSSAFLLQATPLPILLGVSVIVRSFLCAL